MSLMKSIGERIKALRTEQGMTLTELGEKVALSVSYLSQIERDKTTPSLSTLMDIAKALNVGLRYFFETEAEAAYVVRADEGQADFAPDSSTVCLRLVPEVGSSKIEAFRVVLQPHTSPHQLAPFTGEEFSFVVSGKLTLSVGDEQFVLDAGDSIHYDALQPHCWCNAGDEPCVIIWGRVASLELS